MDAYTAQAIDSLHRLTANGAVDRWLTRCPLWVRTVPLAEGEVCYAVYENAPGSPEDAAAVTNLGLYLRRPAGWEFIGHRDVGQVMLLGEQTAAPMLLLRLRSGRIAAFPVRGGADRREEAGRFRDFIDAIRRGAARELGAAIR